MRSHDDDSLVFSFPAEIRRDNKRYIENGFTVHWKSWGACLGRRRSSSKSSPPVVHVCLLITAIYNAVSFLTPSLILSILPGKVDVISADKELVYDEGSKYVTVFDPLDGSSNVDAGIPTGELMQFCVLVYMCIYIFIPQQLFATSSLPNITVYMHSLIGTIFGIFHHDETCDISAFLESDGDVDLEDIACMVNTLQPGTNLAASGYVLYSSSTILTMTIGQGVYGFTLDEQLGEFVLSHPCIEIPETKNIMSFNEANWDMWDEPMQHVHSTWRTGQSKAGERYTSRYVGSMVADVHRTLMYGGVFGYPADSKNTNGKLRLLYEAAPMSFLIEQAGGLSSTGRERIMDVVPDNVHQRVPVVMGSRNEVQEVIDEYEKWDGEQGSIL